MPSYSSIKKIPKLKFSNGFQIPVIGLGTWKSKAGDATKAVQTAIDVGYRHIDCALYYENEHEIGKAIASKLASKTVTRDELFVTSKLWNTHHRPDLVLPAIKRTLCDLRLDYLDLYLMHWPMAYKEGFDLVPKDPDRKGKVLYSKVDYVDTWQAMETLVHKCLTKSIGTANFNKRQLECVFKSATIPPVVNQVECHPYLNQHPLMKYCHSKGMVVICYSPLGSRDRPWAKKGEPVLLEDPTLLVLAKKYNKSPAQLVLRYQIERGNVVIPKSTNKDRLAQNLDIFDIKLTCEDIQAIDKLNKGLRFVAVQGDSSHPEHPFVNDTF